MFDVVKKIEKCFDQSKVNTVIIEVHVNVNEWFTWDIWKQNTINQDHQKPNPLWQASRETIHKSSIYEELEAILRMTNYKYFHYLFFFLLLDYVFCIFFLGFYLIKQFRHERGERGGMTCSKGTQVRTEPAATAARTKPLYMGLTLYQES